jgi:hypothetical protein
MHDLTPGLLVYVACFGCAGRFAADILCELPFCNQLHSHYFLTGCPSTADNMPLLFSGHPAHHQGTNLHDLQQAAASPATAQQLAAPAAPAAAASTPANFFGSLFPTIPNINSSLRVEYPGSAPANVNGSSSGSGGAPRVQLGPGQDLSSLAQQIERGR